MTREEAIRKLKERKREYLDNWIDYSRVAEAYDMAITALAEPERKKGKWIIDQCGWFADCSVCNEPLRLECNGIQLFDELPKFCPHCGAKMSNGEECNE